MFSWFKRTPTTKDAIRRLLILKAVFLKGRVAAPLETIASHLPPEDLTEVYEQFDRLLEGYPSSLKASGLWKDASEGERVFFSAKAPDITPQQLKDASWTVEAISALSWALGFAPQLQAYEQECDPAVIDALPGESTTELIEAARLRQKEEILLAREQAELWHWRARTRQIQDENSAVDLPEGLTLDKVIEMAVTKGAEDGLLPAPINADFPVHDKAYRDLSPDEYQSVFSITRERHRTFNWLCGYSPSGKWADTPTDT